MTTRVPLLALGLLAAGGLLAPSSVFLETAAPGVEISCSRTEAVVATSAAGARASNGNSPPS